jgi:hypothetical protein
VSARAHFFSSTASLFLRASAHFFTFWQPFIYLHIEFSCSPKRFLICPGDRLSEKIGSRYMRIAKAIGIICAVSVLSSTALLIVAGCGFRVSASDFPVLRLSSSTAQIDQDAERR